MHLCCSVAPSCSTLCDPMDCSMPAFPVLHYLPEFAGNRVHWVSDAWGSNHFILLPPFPSAFCLSQHQGLFQWVGSSHQVTRALELQLQHQSFNEFSVLISFRIDWFDLDVQGTLKIVLQHHSLKYQFFSTQPSLWSNSHIHTWLLEKPHLWLYRPLSEKWCLYCLSLS